MQQTSGASFSNRCRGGAEAAMGELVVVFFIVVQLSFCGAWFCSL
jgi:hypothetical protein